MEGPRREEPILYSQNIVGTMRVLNLGYYRKAQLEPGEHKMARGLRALRGPRGAEGAPGGSRRLQEAPGGSRKLQEAPGRTRRLQEAT